MTRMVQSVLVVESQLALLASQWQYITAMATPVCTDIGDSLKSMWNAMVDLVLVGLLHKGTCQRDYNMQLSETAYRLCV